MFPPNPHLNIYNLRNIRINTNNYILNEYRDPLEKHFTNSVVVMTGLKPVASAMRRLTTQRSALSTEATSQFIKKSFQPYRKLGNIIYTSITIDPLV